MGEPTLPASQREVDSDARLAELTGAINTAIGGGNGGDAVPLGALTVFCAGSFARGEGSTHSDIDLFFAYPTGAVPPLLRRTNELKLFGRLIDIAERLAFPPFSRDALYLRTISTDDMMPHVGGPKDDDTNFFTMRMLMLLESRCIVGQASYEAILDEILDWYFYDTRKHPDDFEPWALFNDIIRYWRTILLNYENVNFTKRDGGATSAYEAQVERRARKFKLKFSRATTCFATIAAIAAAQRPATKASIAKLVGMPPMARLRTVQGAMPASESIIEELAADYEWFLQQTAQSKSDLHAALADDSRRMVMSERARAYGDKLYQLLTIIDDGRPADARRLVRYLVV